MKGEQEQAGGGGEVRSPRSGALRDASRALGRRPLCESEMRRELTRRGHPASEIERVVGRLREAGQLDDLALARHHIVSRAERLGYGRERLLRELEGRGVPAETARAAWDELVRDGDLDPEELLRRAVRRRRGEGGRQDARSLRRIYNALLRAGFERSDIRRELGGGSGVSAFFETEDEHDDFR